MSKNTQNGGSIVKQLKEVNGLFTCFLEHQVTKTTAQFKWTGPKIPEAEWHSMLEFFQWSYDTTKSETQVRLYVNKLTATWKIWAYPQEAKTGMSARELDDDPKTKDQRAQFNPDDGWLYFGTVHHHCSCSAFQSATDESNEKGQDGIHITIGNMEAKRYSIHDRFYIGGQKIDHDMSWFWDVGEVMADVPAWAAKLLPYDILDRIARGQMCEKSPEGTTFPEIWKDNLVYKAPVVTIYSSQSYVGGLGYTPTHGHTRFQRVATNLTFDLATAWEQLEEYCVEQNLNEVDVIAEMQHIIKNDKFLLDLIALMYRNDVTIEKFSAYCADEFCKDVEKASAPKQIPDISKKKDNGIPDHMGSDWRGSEM